MNHKFQIGETVLVIDHEPDYDDQMRDPTWGIGMRHYCGKEAVVVAYRDDGYYAIEVSGIGTGYIWPDRWLVGIEPEPVDAWLDELELIP